MGASSGHTHVKGRCVECRARDWRRRRTSGDIGKTDCMNPDGTAKEEDIGGPFLPVSDHTRYQKAGYASYLAQMFENWSLDGCVRAEQVQNVHVEPRLLRQARL